MKTTLLKLALCAFAALPLGAWGQTWDFTSWSDATIVNLNADVALGSGNLWRIDGEVKDETNKNIYGYVPSETASGTGVALMANSVAISELSGLTFDYPSGSDKKPRIYIYNQDDKKALWFKSASNNERVNVLNLSAGKKITIVSKSNGSSYNSQMVSTTETVAPLNQSDASNSQRTDEFVVSSFASGTITASFGGSESHGIYIYSITVSDATAEELQTANNTAYENYNTAGKVATTTLWTFDQYVGKDDVAGGTAVNYNGLWLRGDESNISYVESLGIRTSFSLNSQTGYAYSTLRVQNGRAATGNPASSVNTYLCGIDVAVAGTLYVYARVSSATASGGSTPKTFDINFESGTVDKHQPANLTDYAEYSRTCTGAGTFTFGGEGRYYIMAVKFVPTNPVYPTKKITMSDMGLMTFSDIHSWQLPEGLDAYTFTANQSDGVWSLRNDRITDKKVPASMGVVLKGTHNAEYTLTMVDAPQIAQTLTSMLRPVAIDYALPTTPTYTASGKNMDNYILAKSGSDMVFAKSNGTGSNLAAGKAYFSLRRDIADAITSQGARAFVLSFDDETTNICSIDNGQLVKGNYYNLNGQRISQPTKGLYIMNSKKVIIK